MDALRCPPDDADVTTLSGGERRRVALCRLLLPPPTCCCSTSPPTTSTPRRVDWLERFLQDYPGTVVAITHDRYFLDNVAKWILELDHGRGILGDYHRILPPAPTPSTTDPTATSKRHAASPSPAAPPP